MRAHLKPALGIAKYTAMEAVRTRYSFLLLSLLLAGLGVAMFAGQIALTETAQIQATLTAALLRIAGVVLVALFVISSLVREFNDKAVDMMLSLPLPRAGYFFGKLVGYIAVAVLTSIPVGLLVFSQLPSTGALFWTLSFALELTLVAGISLMFAFNFGQLPAAFLATLAFYFLARSLAALQLMVAGPMASQQLLSEQVLQHLVNGMAYLMPDLDRFTSSGWLVGAADVSPALGSLAGETLVYLLVVAAVGLFDLYRKNF